MYQLLPYLQKKKTRLRSRISVDVQVAQFLHHIGAKGHYRKTTKGFRAYSDTDNVVLICWEN